MFRVRAIQVEHGDSLLVSYGDECHLRHMLVDGGTTESIGTLLDVLKEVRDKDGQLRLEALVVTHYDLDHIEGVIELLGNVPSWLEIADVWFNGRRHLPRHDKLGQREGDVITHLIDGKFSWNAKFREKDPQAAGTIEQKCGPIFLAGGMEVRILSPDRERLSALASAWDSEIIPVSDKEPKPRDTLGRSDPWPPKAFDAAETNSFASDKSVPNGSSIALLLTYDERRVVLAADAFAGVLKKGLELHLPTGTPIDLLKVSHHGSKANTDRPLLKMIKCKKFLISTSGKVHKHPDHALIARLVVDLNEPEIFFNYGVGWPWNWHSRLMDWPPFRAHFPSTGQRFIEVLL